MVTNRRKFFGTALAERRLLTYAVVIGIPCQDGVVLGDAEARLLLGGLVRLLRLLGILRFRSLASFSCNIVKSL